MAKRLVRAKQKIVKAGIPYRVPPAHLLPERVPGVLGVLYLLFNEGYSATAGADLIRQGLSAEAIRLARVLDRPMPDEPEAAGLLALMLMHDARRAARLDADGEIVTLEDQDRSSWDAASISEGVAILEDALRRGRPGPYQVQAAIAACHVTAARASDTDWAQIALLYGQLARFLPTPRWRGWHWSRHCRSRGSWPATTCWPPPGRTCTAAWAGRKKRRPATARRWSWPAPTPNGATSAAA